MYARCERRSLESAAASRSQLNKPLCVLNAVMRPLDRIPGSKSRQATRARDAWTRRCRVAARPTKRFVGGQCVAALASCVYAREALALRMSIK